MANQVGLWNLMRKGFIAALDLSSATWLSWNHWGALWPLLEVLSNLCWSTSDVPLMISHLDSYPARQNCLHSQSLVPVLVGLVSACPDPAHCDLN